jgi:hypothetical protein
MNRIEKADERVEAEYRRTGKYPSMEDSIKKIYVLTHGGTKEAEEEWDKRRAVINEEKVTQ